ncbi:MAG TPA: hypothetical protein VNF04_08390 [Stellaceae bacterium]|nr:hypothetical protein [Stellaceae bacterium]
MLRLGADIAGSTWWLDRAKTAACCRDNGYTTPFLGEAIPKPSRGSIEERLIRATRDVGKFYKDQNNIRPAF